ncbi:MAG: ATP-binding protein [Candidatus Schekmanbacteria bacterium]|nr:ATP-binding protein [Candidatus Schekmanbacteria bacterium]
MASANQLKALLKSYADGDHEHFFAIAMQVAAHEAKLGHSKLAHDLKNIIDDAKVNQQKDRLIKKPIPIASPRGDLSTLLSISYSKIRISDMILSEDLSARLSRIVKEQRQLSKLRAHGLSPRRKLLLIGPPGTGKTMSASALAGEFSLPLFEIRLEGLITKYMGETAAKLRLVFDAITETRGVYLFDEFDSIGSQRKITNDVGEIRRVLNSFLQFIEQDESDSLILAATNHIEILDHALFRRFDDVIQYTLPNKKLIIDTLKARLASYIKNNIDWQKLADFSSGLSYAEITRACEDAVKENIIDDRKNLETNDVIRSISERKSLIHK